MLLESNIQFDEQDWTEPNHFFFCLKNKEQSLRRLLCFSFVFQHSPSAIWTNKNLQQQKTNRIKRYTFSTDVNVDDNKYPMDMFSYYTKAIQLFFFKQIQFIFFFSCLINFDIDLITIDLLCSLRTFFLLSLAMVFVLKKHRPTDKKNMAIKIQYLKRDTIQGITFCCCCCMIKSIVFRARIIDNIYKFSVFARKNPFAQNLYIYILNQVTKSTIKK